MTFIPEEEYQKILKTMPVFCGDFLIFAEKKYLLIKRKEEPVKDVYWVIGGRLRFKETMAELAERVMKQEIGRSFPEFKMIGYSNYIFLMCLMQEQHILLHSYILFLLKRCLNQR